MIKQIIILCVFSLFVFLMGCDNNLSYDKTANKNFSFDTSSIINAHFTNYSGKILYGPYFFRVDNVEKNFYVLDKNVLDINLSKVDNDLILNLHNFYLQTFFEPLFYSPVNSEEEIDFSTFEKYFYYDFKNETYRVPIYPSNFLRNLKYNIISTNEFFSHPNISNAEALIMQNNDTLVSYLNDLTDLLVFLEEISEIGLSENQTTPLNAKCLRAYPMENYFNYLEGLNENTLMIRKKISFREELLNGNSEFIMPTKKIPFIPQEREPEEVIPLDLLDKIITLRLKENYKDFYNYSMDNFKIYWLKSPCIVREKIYRNNSEREGAYISGTKENIFPNLFLVEYTDVLINSFFFGSDNLFTLCSCFDNVFLQTLNWFIIDEFNEDLLSNNVIEEENIFLLQPGQDTLEYLQEVYDYKLKTSLDTNIYIENIGVIWERKNKIGSKIYKFTDVFDNYYNDIHFTNYKQLGYYQYMNGQSEESRGELPENFYDLFSFPSLILSEELVPVSLFTFFEWSDSVYFINPGIQYDLNMCKEGYTSRKEVLVLLDDLSVPVDMEKDAVIIEFDRAIELITNVVEMRLSLFNLSDHVVYGPFSLLSDDIDDNYDEFIQNQSN